MNVFIDSSPFDDRDSRSQWVARLGSNAVSDRWVATAPVRFQAVVLNWSSASVVMCKPQFRLKSMFWLVFCVASFLSGEKWAARRWAAEKANLQNEALESRERAARANRLFEFLVRREREKEEGRRDVERFLRR